MDKIFVIGMLGMLGAAFGSFAGAQVWRLRARQLVSDSRDGEQVDADELSGLKVLDRSVMKDRSECLHCHHRLAWYDMVPLVSWALLAGRCRYCRHPIGVFEMLMEVGVAIVFVLSFLYWPIPLDNFPGWVSFILWLVGIVVMAILFAYDAKWYLLPFWLNVSLIVISIAFFMSKVALDPNIWQSVWSMVGAVGLLAGLYAVFAVFGWVGFGDSILGVSLALFLGKWELAFLALFLANLLGCFMLVPLAFQHKLHRQAHIPFGPFLIAGMVVAFLWGGAIIHATLGSSGVLLVPLVL